MAKIALYRKYRPNNFSGMLGQEHVTQTLKNAVKDAAHSHAYIFTGPRGVGKTSAARLVATAINCKNPKDGEPCGVCEICELISKNKAIDIIEIDAASNRGIDEIRELKEKVKFSPSKLKFKVFIIDEVHMLTKEAFNALLKTLEEPPSHAVFVLATTEIHKVPQTILSRCQRFDFKRISIKDLVRQLKNISKNEKIEISEKALSLIAEASEGGFRDAISSLDQISSYKTQITEEDVTDLLGMSDYETLLKFVSYLKEKRAKEAIESINNLVDKGIDANQFTKNAIEALRKIMLIKVIGREHVELAEEHLDSLGDMADKFETLEIVKNIEIILKNANDLKNSPLPQMPLELSVIEICSTDQSVEDNSLDENQQAINNRAEARISSRTNDIAAIKDNNEKVEVTPESSPESSQKQISKDSKTQEGNGAEHWHDFLLEMKGRNASCYTLLKTCVFRFEKDRLVLTFPFKFHKDRIDDLKNKKIIEEVLAEVYNKSYKIECEVKESVKEKIKEENEKKKKELVAKAVDIFGGELIE